ncbi:hypothetical protein LEMLEM_LOCUS9469 [Lemmus lemmus]
MQPAKTTEKFETIRNQKRTSTEVFLNVDDSSFYPPSQPSTSRYLRTSATWPPQSPRQGTCESQSTEPIALLSS